MASHLKRLIYSAAQELPTSILEQSRHIGPYGTYVSKTNGHKIPFLGQLDISESRGITMLENKMCRAPVFFHSRYPAGSKLHDPKQVNSYSQYFFCAINFREKSNEPT